MPAARPGECPTSAGRVACVPSRSGARESFSVRVDLHAVFTASASGPHKALRALVARPKPAGSTGIGWRSDGGIAVARSLRPVVVLTALLAISAECGDGFDA